MSRLTPMPPHGWAENDPSGVLLGGTIGYNYQFGPNWVAGAEADMSWSGMEGQQHMYIYDGHDWSGGWDGFATIRARIGYAFGTTLFYGTGGLALVHANEVIVGNDADESNFYQGWKTGYVVGAGVEHAFTPRLSGKIEYLYTDGFGSESGPTGTISQPGDQSYIHEIGSIIYRPRRTELQILGPIRIRWNQKRALSFCFVVRLYRKAASHFSGRTLRCGCGGSSPRRVEADAAATPRRGQATSTLSIRRTLPR